MNGGTKWVGTMLTVALMLVGVTLFITSADSAIEKKADRNTDAIVRLQSDVSEIKDLVKGIEAHLRPYR